MSTTLTVSRLCLQGSLLDETDEPAVPADLGDTPMGDPGAADSEGPAGGSGPESGGPRHGPSTLDELIVGTWEGLARGTSQCPVCGGRLEPEFGAHARPVGGRCAECGSTLH